MRTNPRHASRARLGQHTRPVWVFALSALAAGVTLGTGAPPLLAQAARPLPPAQEFLDAVRRNLARSDREQYAYSYMERRSDVHKNPFGRLGTDGQLLYEVKPGEELGIYFKQLVARDGEPVSGEQPQRVDRRNKPEESDSVNDVVSTLSFEIVRRESRNGRDVIVVEFTPKKDAEPRTKQGKMAKAFEGTVWIDEAAREVMRVEATAIDDLSWGWGFVARLNDGARAEMVREQVHDRLWLPKSVRLVGEGRAILFRKMKLDFFIEWYDYERTLPAPGDVRVAESASAR